MATGPKHLTRRILLGACFPAALCMAYIFTAAMIPVLIRHTGDSGRLQWLRSVPGSMTILQTYELPAARLCRLPEFQTAFEFCADLWWAVLDPPDTTP